MTRAGKFPSRQSGRRLVFCKGRTCVSLCTGTQKLTCIMSAYAGRTGLRKKRKNDELHYMTGNFICIVDLSISSMSAVHFGFPILEHVSDFIALSSFFWGVQSVPEYSTYFLLLIARK